MSCNSVPGGYCPPSVERATFKDASRCPSRLATKKPRTGVIVSRLRKSAADTCTSGAALVVEVGALYRGGCDAEVSWLFEPPHATNNAPRRIGRPHTASVARDGRIGTPELRPRDPRGSPRTAHPHAREAEQEQRPDHGQRDESRHAVLANKRPGVPPGHDPYLDCDGLRRPAPRSCGAPSQCAVSASRQ